MTDAFPLQWPEGWPETPPDECREGRWNFKRPGGQYGNEPWTFPDARDALAAELEKFDRNAVISSNFQLGSKGFMVEPKRRPDVQAVAIYFKRSGRQYAIACDRFNDAEGNMRSLTLALQAMRQLDRHGGGIMMEKAFAGFLALPAPPKPWEVLGVAKTASREEIAKAHRTKIAAHHPDQGGSQAAAAEINAARDRMLKDLAG